MDEDPYSTYIIPDKSRTANPYQTMTLNEQRDQKNPNLTSQTPGDNFFEKLGKFSHSNRGVVSGANSTDKNIKIGTQSTRNDSIRYI